MQRVKKLEEFGLGRERRVDEVSLWVHLKLPIVGCFKVKYYCSYFKQYTVLRYIQCNVGMFRKYSIQTMSL